MHSIDITKSFKLVQENQALAERIQQTVTNDEMKSMHDELSLLDEVRYVTNRHTLVHTTVHNVFHLLRLGTTCRHNIEEDDKDPPEDEMSMLGAEECDDNSMLELNSVDAQHTYRSAVTIKVSKRCIAIPTLFIGFVCVFF